MTSKNPERPNILFILSDDQGPWAMNCAGTPELKTPNLDGLATSGIRFENFFCASPVCSPARASILTGQMPSQHGVQDFLRAGNSASLPSDGRTIQYLEGRTTYVEILADNGYDCGLSGKWHLGDSATPQAGFDFWNVHATGAGDYYSAPMFREGVAYSADGYVSDVITDNAIGYLNSQLVSGTPFSLNVHFTAPHAPWGREQHPPELYEGYFTNGSFESVRWDPIHPAHLAKKGSSGSIGRGADERRELLSGYFSAITAMDSNIGRLIGWLERNDLRDNTLVIFSADHGEGSGHHRMILKGFFEEESWAVPLVISQRSTLSGSRSDSSHLISGVDISATICDYAGAPPLPHASIATSLRPFLEGSNDIPWREYVVGENRSSIAIRDEEFKSILYDSSERRLYHLADDPLETRDLVNESGFEHIKESHGNYLAEYAESVVPSDTLDADSIYRQRMARLHGGNWSAGMEELR